MAKKVSIITINYNGKDDTVDLIESFGRYETYPYEIIIIDNGSKNHGEHRVLSKYSPKPIVIRSDKNLGFAGGNNLGISYADGDYILFLNNDTIINQPILENLARALDNNPQIGCVSPKIACWPEKKQLQYAGTTPMSPVTLRNENIGFGQTDTRQFNKSRYTAFAHGAAMMIRTTDIKKFGMMPEFYFLYYEELDWSVRIREQGRRIVYDPRCTVFHKESATTGQQSPLRSYCLTRNRLLFAWRNLRGGARLLSVAYQLCIAAPKNAVSALAHRRGDLAKAVCRGVRDFFTLKNKQA